MNSEFIREGDPVDEFVERKAGQQRYGVVTSLEILVEIRLVPVARLGGGRLREHAEPLQA